MEVVGDQREAEAGPLRIARVAHEVAGVVFLTRQRVSELHVRPV